LSKKKTFSPKNCERGKRKRDSKRGEREGEREKKGEIEGERGRPKGVDFSMLTHMTWLATKIPVDNFHGKDSTRLSACERSVYVCTYTQTYSTRGDQMSL
jgi:hypothetical protein